MSTNMSTDSDSESDCEECERCSYGSHSDGCGCGKCLHYKNEDCNCTEDCGYAFCDCNEKYRNMGVEEIIEALHKEEEEEEERIRIFRQKV